MLRTPLVQPSFKAATKSTKDSEILVQTEIGLKIVLLGDSGVGKTSILDQYINSNFRHLTQPTLGSMFLSNTLQVKDINYRLQIWDTAGQERFKAIAPLYYRDADIVILVLDPTDQKSFDNLQYWTKQIKQKGPTRFSLCLLVNKQDLKDQSVVSQQDIESFNQKNGSVLRYCSALTGEGIHEAFEDMLQHHHDGHYAFGLGHVGTSEGIEFDQSIDSIASSLKRRRGFGLWEKIRGFRLCGKVESLSPERDDDHRGFFCC